jgi:hypothetical protein
MKEEDNKVVEGENRTSELQPENSFNEGFAEAKEFSLAMQEHSHIASVIDNDTIRETIHIAKLKLNIKEKELDLDHDFKCKALKNEAAKEKSERNFRNIIIYLIFAFLFFTTIYFIYLGKDQLYEKVIAFIFGLLSGIGIGSSKILGSKKDEKEKQIKDK